MSRSISPALIRDHVQGDDRQDASSHQSCPGDEHCRQVCADSGDRLQRGLPKLGIAAPVAQHSGAADDKRSKRQRNEEDIEAKERASC